ncbi:hypothetical protein PAMC26510_02505 [Caballeronia sordidicola]|uniref:Uncharacterized protein n=1 Tax=Caballeronia sordidicola TaxID=196367 RepID=A0A242NA11_CABSO|nr:hypothetical protein PAMC26510_02505 [Caballeronia sordidicola]
MPNGWVRFDSRRADAALSSARRPGGAQPQSPGTGEDHFYIARRV